MAAKRGRPRKNTEVGSSGYHPTEEELNEDVSINASPEEVIQSLFPKNQPVEKSGKGEQVKKEWDEWLKSLRA